MAYIFPVILSMGTSAFIDRNPFIGPEFGDPNCVKNWGRNEFIKLKIYIFLVTPRNYSVYFTIFFCHYSAISHIHRARTMQ
jgi:hypothetical protein